MQVLFFFLTFAEILTKPNLKVVPEINERSIVIEFWSRFLMVVRQKCVWFAESNATIVIQQNCATKIYTCVSGVKIIELSILLLLYNR